jgi:precorrin-6A/cobalt-precorrin-6A reductase
LASESDHHAGLCCLAGKVVPVKVLILGGTAQGRALAAELHGRDGCRVVSSLAGRTRRPTLPEGEVRVGGFGGAEGLAEYLRAEAIDVLIDATHPFAQGISAHAAQAAEATGVRLIALRRACWSPEPGDLWIHVPDIEGAAREAAEIRDGGCIFVTTGAGGLAAYAGDARHRYLIRTVDSPTEALPPRHTIVLDRGPYTVEGELALMDEHGVCALVTKNSGGELTKAKLTAARRRGIPVIMVDPPAPLAGVVSVETVAQVVRLVS